MQKKMREDSQILRLYFLNILAENCTKRPAENTAKQHLHFVIYWKLGLKKKVKSQRFGIDTSAVGILGSGTSAFYVMVRSLQIVGYRITS